MKWIRSLLTRVSVVAMSATTFAAEDATRVLPPTEVADLAYTNEFFPGTRYREQVPTQQSVVGFANGQRAASAAEIERCIRAWTGAAPDRTRLVEYARSHEGRPLHYVVVAAPDNLSRLDEVRERHARLGDPRKLAEGEAERLVKELPAVAWLGFTIHGDETEGSDAALAMLYHLIAADDPGVAGLLKEVVVIIDPLMNPDGRDRFIKMVAEHRGAAPNLDSQSLLHAGYWPRGRGNHYLFDLNRDWILGVHPETRGRIREVVRWNPQLFIDGHGMGAHDTHLFSPPRAPINPNIPKERAAWGALFARDQARAFDREKLVYYTGEWHEEWYPGYSDAWASYRGVVGILYEQARVAEDGVRRAGGRILSYRESLRHHVIGAMANLATLQSNRQAMLEYFLGTRKSATAPDGPYANRTFAILPTANQSRLSDLVDLLRLQGIEVYQAGRAFTATAATDQLGRLVAETNLAAGTILIPNRQPLGRLVAGMLEFDPRLPRDVLEEERQELLRTGKSRIYDITAWNLSMVYGLDALTLSQEMPADAKPWAAISSSGANALPAAKEVVAYIIDGTDDRSVAAAARLMERNVEVCVAEKPFRFEGKDFVRGSVLVTVLDNRGFQGGLQEAIRQTAEGLGLSAVGIRTGLGDGDLPDLGGRHFQRLEPPKIAMFSRGGFSPSDFGSIWFVLDKHLAIRHSHLDEERSPELARYNVVVLPDRGRERLPDEMVAALKDWVKAGGTLIAIGGSASNVTSEKAAFSKVRLLPDVLDKLPDYELAVLREWQARNHALPTETDLWAHTVSPQLAFPWQPGSAKPPEERELKKRDAWQKLFMPEGTLLACRVDTNHWLTAGCGSLLPVLVGNDPILMAAEGVETAIRYGYWTAADTNRITNAAAKTGSQKSAEAGKPDAKDPPRIGWCALPEGTELQLRMSGLLWPEAAHRLANAAYVTRESFGRGQIILFATSPTFRASARGTMRVFLNALICGPGVGAAPRIEP